MNGRVGEAPRAAGAPSDRRTDREGARLGRQRTPDDIPSQGTVHPIAVVATYVLGPPTRPPITFDNGFLDRFPPRAPTVSDRLELARWRVIVEGAEVLRPDLVDATAAYRHFLDGGGRRREFSYERYVRADTSGRTTLRNAVLSIQWGTLELWRAYHRTSFSLTGSAISCGSDNMFPYPATENWQKAIGGHVIWLSGVVRVEADSSCGAARCGQQSAEIAAARRSSTCKSRCMRRTVTTSIRERPILRPVRRIRQTESSRLPALPASTITIPPWNVVCDGRV